MDSETHGAGVDAPVESGGDSDPPLYKFGDGDERIRSLVHSIGLIVGAFLVGTALVLASFSILRQVGFTVESVSAVPAEIRAVAAALQFVGFFLVALLYIRWRGSEEPLFDVSLPSLRDVGWIVAGLIGLFVLLNVVSFVIEQLGVTPAENAVIAQGQQQPEFLLYLIPIAFLFNAPAEELLFRGLIQGLFRRAYGIIPGVVIASVMFGVVHYVALGGTGSRTVYLAIAAVLGLVLGLLYEKTENLAVPILVHALFNAIQFYIAYLLATGQIAAPG